MTSVITTINYPTEAVKEVSKRTNLIVVGDRKTPKDWWIAEHIDQFIGVDVYKDNWNVLQFLPENHYARKNIGYLAAIESGAKVIYDTDDDNIPNEKWQQRTLEVEASESVGQGWYNVYDLVSDVNIWPRGFSLKHLKKKPSCGKTRTFTSSIQQGLADGEPDVDAIWRLVINKSNSFDLHRPPFVFLTQNFLLFYRLW